MSAEAWRRRILRLLRCVLTWSDRLLSAPELNSKQSGNSSARGPPTPSPSCPVPADYCGPFPSSILWKLCHSATFSTLTIFARKIRHSSLRSPNHHSHLGKHTRPETEALGTPSRNSTAVRQTLPGPRERKRERTRPAGSFHRAPLPDELSAPMWLWLLVPWTSFPTIFSSGGSLLQPKLPNPVWADRLRITRKNEDEDGTFSPDRAITNLLHWKLPYASQSSLETLLLAKTVGKAALHPLVPLKPQHYLPRDRSGREEE